MNGSSPQHKLYIAALTGSIGSGKSQAAEFFEALGASVVDADILARKVVEPGSPALEEIAATFGPTVISPGGTLDRKALGQIVFSDSELRLRLEDILHPRIRERYLQELEKLSLTSPPPTLVVYVVPLLFESRYEYPEVNAIVVVSAPRETCVTRIMSRDQCSRELAEKKYDSQIPIEEKVRRADYVIPNDSTIDALREHVRQTFAALQREAAQKAKDAT